MAATMTQIAKEANVSISLVSRYFNEDPTLRITEDKVLRIQRAKERLGGLKVNRSAKIRKRQLTRNFVMPLPQKLSMDWFGRNFASTEWFLAMQKALRANDFRISLSLIDLDDLIEFTEDMINNGYCDGLFLECRIVDERFANYLLKNRIPHVCTDRTTERFGINTVGDYAISGLRQSVDHLLKLGHRHIGYVGTDYRFADFLTAMMEHGAPFNHEDMIDIGQLPIGDDQTKSRDYASQAFSERFTPSQGPTAYVCQNDYISFGVNDVLRQHNLKAGVDVSLIGYDNIEQRDPDHTDEPFLTTVDVPFDKIGVRCAEVLMEQALNRRENIVHEHIPLELVVRSTTGVCPS